ncbi:MAG: hypothetical protein LC643_08305 [Bacteroidales bacterium]|nr:hypothetical protein [Bacteroidales bacterium]
MKTIQYQKIRDISIRLTQTIFDWGGNKFQHRPAAQKLNLWHEEGLSVEDDSDMESFMEYLLYYGKHQRQLILDQFFDSEIALGDTEEMILEGMVNSEISLFEIHDLDRSPDACRIYLTDLFNKGSYVIINQGLSKTASCGTIIGARLIEIAPELYMTSGSSFADKRFLKGGLFSTQKILCFAKQKMCAAPSQMGIGCQIPVFFLAVIWEMFEILLQLTIRQMHG